MTREEYFTDVYLNKRWGEPVSGIGSTDYYTKDLLELLPLVLHYTEAKSVFDAGCGDLNWMKNIEFPDKVNYIGGDIVKPLIEENKRKFPDKNFINIDIIQDDFPSCDLIICRAVLFHYSHQDIQEFMERLYNSKAKWVLMTSHSYKPNIDIPTFSYRFLNMLEPPFSLPTPEMSLKDNPDDFPENNLMLWRVETIFNTKLMKEI
jgi:SAM-dependent methyltransferase